MLCLGYYPDDYKPIVRHRFEHQYFVFEEKYHRLNEEELTAMFAQLEASIPQPNKYGAENAAQYTFARKTGAAFSCEMDRSIRKAMENWQGGNPLVDQHV
jgi:hypothetical protein